MASKTKMRCATCGKWFQSANAKDTICPDCAQKARKEKLAAKAAPPTPTKATVVQNTPPPPKPKPQHVQSGTNQWLDKVSDVKVAEPEQPVRPKIPSSPKPRDTRGGPGDTHDGEDAGNTREGSGNYRDREGGNRGPNYRENTYRPPSSPYRVGGGSGLPDAGPRPRQPMDGSFTRGPRPERAPTEHPDRPPRPAGQGGPKGGKPKVKTPKPPPVPKPKREKIEPPKPFEPTAEQITLVETRYIELATPIEFDGIRTQIAHELEIPKTAVKKIIKNLRDRQHIPSWWEAQSFKGNEEELAKIKAAYEPYLPLPDVGIHKKIAEELSLKPGDVYQAIKKIRTDMGLPQYNDPELHPELKLKKLTEATGETPSETETQSGTETLSAPVPTDALNGSGTETVVDAVKDEAKPEVVVVEPTAETNVITEP
ncbi:MAG: hypothetical protein NVS4B1_17870 [Ktedonobacteraceae bacterium]